MRRLQAILFGMLLLVVMAVPAAAAENTMRIYLDGTEVTYDAAPFVENGRTLVPLRGLSESMGFQVDYLPAEQKITMTRNQTEIVLWLDSNRVLVNGEETTLDVPAKAIGGRTFVPLRFLSERLGASVFYDSTANAVRVTPDAAKTQLQAMYQASQADANATMLVHNAFDYTMEMNMFGMVQSMEMPLVMTMHTDGGNMLISSSMSMPGAPPIAMTVAMRDGFFYMSEPESGQWFVIGEYDPSNPTDMSALSGDAGFLSGFGAGVQMGSQLDATMLANATVTYGATEMVGGVEATRIDVVYPSDFFESIMETMLGSLGLDGMLGTDVQIKSMRLNESNWIHPTTARLLKAEVDMEVEIVVNDPTMGQMTMMIYAEGGSQIDYNPGPIQWPAGLDKAEPFPTFDWDF